MLSIFNAAAKASIILNVAIMYAAVVNVLAPILKLFSSVVAEMHFAST
jgi:hypothetical protein